MRIQHNIMAMNAYRNYNNNTSALSKNLEKLSSGYKINRAGDDAAGLAISEKMRAQISGLNAATKNVKDGISLVKTAEGAMQEVQDMLNRMSYLATQSANGTYDNEVDRANLQKEVNALCTEIDRIADSANFNGIKLMDGSLATSGTSASLAEVDLSKLLGQLGGSTKTVDAVKGVYEMSATFGATATVAENDKISATFTLTDADGKQQNITIDLTVAKDSNNKLQAVVGEDGTSYALADENKTDAAALGTAFAGELAKNSIIKDNFTVSATAGKLTFKAKEGGTQAMQVTGIANSHTKAADGQVTMYDNAMKVTTPAADPFQTVDLSKATVFDGSKDLDKAVFEINGEKFVFVANGKVDADSLAKLKEAGVEHYVECGTGSTIDAAEVKNMAEKISMETGLKVEQGSTGATGDLTTWTKDTTPTNTEIALKSNSTSSTSKGGLTLQIGDTADKFNQMVVSVGDMHVKALGIGSVDISSQEGAAVAVDKIKAAINSVSSTRGDLGAIQNRLEHTQNNLSVMTENIQDAESTIRDTDVADEMMAYTKNNILIQSAQAMLAQANAVPQGVLQLLQ